MNEVRKYDEYITTTDQGPATLRMPSKLSPESLKDFEDWIAIVLRGIKRRAAGQLKVVNEYSIDPIGTGTTP